MQEHRRAIVTTLLVLGAIALAVVVVKVLDAVGDPTPHAGGLPVSAVLPRATPARAPFAGLSELKVAVGYDHCLRLAVADTLDERVAGLRDRTDLGPYDGMLFVFQGPSNSGFTMSGVTVPLDIAALSNRQNRANDNIEEVIDARRERRLIAEPGERRGQREHVGAVDVGSRHSLGLSEGEEPCAGRAHRDARGVQCGLRVLDGGHHRLRDTTVVVRARDEIM